MKLGGANFTGHALRAVEVQLRGILLYGQFIADKYFYHAYETLLIAVLRSSTCISWLQFSNNGDSS